MVAWILFLCVFLFSQQKHNCNSGNADDATAYTDPETGIGVFGSAGVGVGWVSGVVGLAVGG